MKRPGILPSALAIPVYLADGKEFPERDLVLFISFVVILITLVVQGLTLPWLIKKLKLDEDKPEIPAEIQPQQIHGMLMKLSIERLEEKHAALLRTNTLVRNLKQRLTDDIDYTRLNIESLKDNKDEKQQVSEFNDVLMDLGEFLNKQLSSLRQKKLFDEDVIRLEEGRIVLEQNKIG
jgi:CPA1 family monovalent cation:H+ antiporter